MKSQTLSLLACVFALMLVVAACGNGNGDDAETNGETDTIEETEGTDEEATPEDEETVEDETTPEETVTEDEETPEATEEADTTPDDTGMAEQETAQVTISEEDGVSALAIVHVQQDGTDANGATDEETPEATDEEETPEGTDGEETPEATDDEDDNGMMDQAVTFSGGSILFEVSNESETAYGLAIEQADGAVNGTEGTDDAQTPEATDDEETPEATDEDAEETPAMDGDSMAVEELGETIDAGSSTEWEVELDAGDYVMYVVNEDGEREANMEAEFTVEEGGMMDGDDTEDEETPGDTDDEATPEETEEEDDES